MITEVRTSAGTVRGRWEDGVAVFRGVPFAAPPVGRNRFTAPRPAVPWDEVRDVTRFGPPPPQPGRPTDEDDWLNLAVWTPDPGRTGLPVVVWISGGTHLNCNTANPHFAGATLAAAGAVVVSAHYRTGVEGFARLDGAPDNRGLLDQVAALRWVQDNITAFGGDPGNVTVLGQSAGAGSIAALLVMPAAAGLFRRAILQSLPGTFFTTGLAADVAAEVSAELGRSPRVEDLADVPPDDLVAAARSVTDRLPQRAGRWGAVAYTPTPFSPVVDGEVLPASPWAALSNGAAPDVDLLVGHTRDEFSLLAARLGEALGDVDDAGVDTLLTVLTPTPGAQRYRAAYPSASPNELRDTAMSDTGCGGCRPSTSPRLPTPVERGCGSTNSAGGSTPWAPRTAWTPCSCSAPPKSKRAHGSWPGRRGAGPAPVAPDTDRTLVVRRHRQPRLGSLHPPRARHTRVRRRVHDRPVSRGAGTRVLA
jgi:para-nitrobenzyl esterase